MSPRVSVVVPTFNRARDVARCLESLAAQTYRDFEVLVCDDGSKDNTREVVEGFKDRLDVSYHWAENWGGPARPRNTGIGLARGEFIAFLDSDDWWAPEKLARSVQALDAGADLVYHPLYIVDFAGQANFRKRLRCLPLEAPAFESLLRSGNMIPNSSVVVRTGLMREVGAISEDRALIAGEDYEAWLRVARRTDRFAWLDDCLGFYWMGGGHISSGRRTLSNLSRLDELYFSGERRAQPGWFHYMLGLSHYELGSFREARGHLWRAVGRVSPAQSAKAAVTWLLACARLVLNGRPAVA
jgi:glycosyltransferase involved in cell wall biosynthesis